MARLTVTLTIHLGLYHFKEHFDATLNENGEVTAEDIRAALASCSHRYRVSPERAEFLADELFRYGEAEHGWSTITYDSGECLTSTTGTLEHPPLRDADHTNVSCNLATLQLD